MSGFFANHGIMLKRQKGTHNSLSLCLHFASLTANVDSREALSQSVSHLTIILVS